MIGLLFLINCFHECTTSAFSFFDPNWPVSHKHNPWPQKSISSLHKSSSGFTLYQTVSLFEVRKMRTSNWLAKRYQASFIPVAVAICSCILNWEPRALCVQLQQISRPFSVNVPFLRLFLLSQNINLFPVLTRACFVISYTHLMPLSLRGLEFSSEHLALNSFTRWERLAVQQRLG